MADLDLAGIITRTCSDLRARFAALVHSHAASDITSGTLDAARLPVATTSAIGGVKVDGATVTISDGVISASGGGGGGGTYYGTAHQSESAQQVKHITASGFTQAVGTVLVATFASANTYQPSSANPLKLSVNGGSAVSVRYQGSYNKEIPWEVSDTLTFVYTDENTWKLIGTDNPVALLPVASAITRGVVKVGSGLEIDADGVLSVSAQSGYPITLAPNFDMHCFSVTLDGTYGTGVYATSAAEGDTVTVALWRHWEPQFTRDDTSAAITTTQVATYSNGPVVEFTMPASGVTLDAWYND